MKEIPDLIKNERTKVRDFLYFVQDIRYVDWHEIWKDLTKFNRNRCHEHKQTIRKTNETIQKER